MPKKKTKPRKPTSRTQTVPTLARMGPTTGPVRLGPVSLGPLAPALTELHPLREEFITWAANTSAAEGAAVQELWDDASFVVMVAAQELGLQRLGDWTPALVRELGDVVRDMDDDPDLDPDEDLASHALPSLLPLLAFLTETGRCDASPQALREIQDTLAEVMEELAPGSTVLAALAGVGVDPRAESAALAAMPLMAQVEALLRWVGRRRAVTTTGALRRADIAPAAALIATEASASASTSMWEVTTLAAVWVALQEAGLLEVTKTVAVPTDAGRRWLDGDAVTAGEARRAVAVAYLMRVLTEPAIRSWLPSAADVLVPVLAGAACGQAVPMAALDLEAAAELTGQGPDALADLFGAGRDPQRLQALVMEPARVRLDRLADDGFLRLGSMVEVTPGVGGLVAEVLAGLLLQAIPGAQGLDEVIVPVGPPTTVARLRIELVDAMPPVWRRVEVDPRTSLGDLHDVVQAAMGWEDDHLHSFTGKGAGRERVQYSCVELGLEDVVEEHSVTISDVLKRVRTTLGYTYDFGDGWEHAITLEATEPVPPGTEPLLPRCTAGAGACPEEDSGGLWGWLDKVNAAADPANPDHADVREWLGLGLGETLDPAAFDLAEADRRVGELREG